MVGRWTESSDQGLVEADIATAQEFERAVESAREDTANTVFETDA